MADYSLFLDSLAGALSKRGLSTTRSVGPGRFPIEILATKGDFSALKGNWAHFILATTMDLPSIESVTEFSRAAGAFCVANAGRYVAGWKVGYRFNNYVAVPVTVSQTFSDEMRNWMSKKNPVGGLVPFNLPVLLSSSNREVYYCRKLPFVGAMGLRNARKFVEEILGPSTMEELRS